MPLLDPSRIPLLAAGAAMLALAGVLLWMDFAKRVNRAFAVYLIARGGTLVLPALSGPRLERLALDLQAYFLLALVPAALYFASLYPRRRGPLSGRWGGWIALAATVAIFLLYIADHGLYQTLARTPEGAGPGSASASWDYVDQGPLFALGMLAAVALQTLHQ